MQSQSLGDYRLRSNLNSNMQQEQIYYLVINEKSIGPFTLDEVILNPQLTPDTLVWKPGLDNWVAAKTFPELNTAFLNQRPYQDYNTPPEYNQPNYQNHPDYNQQPRQENPEYNRFSDNPQYKSGHNYHNHDRYYERYDKYQNGYRQNVRTNWLPWAIVATVVGFFASCIGAIFGIIAIVQANKANTLYAQGFDREGDAANSNAKIMTIIGLVFAGIGIIVAFSFGSIFNSISNLSYL